MKRRIFLNLTQYVSYSPTMGNKRPAVDDILITLVKMGRVNFPYAETMLINFPKLTCRRSIIPGLKRSLETALKDMHDECFIKVVPVGDTGMLYYLDVED